MKSRTQRKLKAWGIVTASILAGAFMLYCFSKYLGHPPLSDGEKILEAVVLSLMAGGTIYGGVWLFNISGEFDENGNTSP